MDLETDEAEAIIAYVNEKFETGSPSSRYFLAHVDAWAFGGIAIWDQLTVTEREWVVGVVTVPVIPPSEVLEKVIGTAAMIANHNTIMMMMDLANDTLLGTDNMGQ